MKEKRLGIRIDEKRKELLEAYAKKDNRSLSNLILKILDDWVREQEKLDSEDWLTRATVEVARRKEADCPYLTTDLN